MHLVHESACNVEIKWSNLGIHVPLSPITPYVAPIKEKLLLHAVHAVLEEKYTQQQQYSGVSSVLSSLCSVQLAMETFNAKHTQP